MALASEVGRPFVLLYSTAEKPSLLSTGSTEGVMFRLPEAFSITAPASVVPDPASHSPASVDPMPALSSHLTARVCPDTKSIKRNRQSRSLLRLVIAVFLTGEILWHVWSMENLLVRACSPNTGLQAPGTPYYNRQLGNSEPVTHCHFRFGSRSSRTASAARAQEVHGSHRPGNRNGCG